MWYVSQPSTSRQRQQCRRRHLSGSHNGDPTDGCTKVPNEFDTKTEKTMEHAWNYYSADMMDGAVERRGDDCFVVHIGEGVHRGPLHPEVAIFLSAAPRLWV